MNDFTLNARNKADSYRSFITVLKGTSPSYTHLAFLRLESRPKNAFLCRHDVDHDLDKALQMARIEAELGVHSSYYLLPTGAYGECENYYGVIRDGRIHHKRALFDVAREIISYGHEVGLHNDFVQLSSRLHQPVDTLLRQEMAVFAENGISISGTASHGSRFVRDAGFVNYEIFSDRANKVTAAKQIQLPTAQIVNLPLFQMKDFGLEYEAYDINWDTRISDVGGRLIFATRPKVVGEFDFLNGSMNNYPSPSSGVIVALVHPEHWTQCCSAPRTSNSGSASHSPGRLAAAPTIAKRSKSIHGETSTVVEPVQHTRKLLLKRADGAKLRIAARGDCVTRRAISLNRELFPDDFTLMVNEKATSLQFVESIEGKPCNLNLTADYVDHASMPGALGKYFSYQFDRSILDSENLDLLVMDTYSDMNFQMWTHKRDQWSMWIHPKYSDLSKIEKDFVKIGLCSFDTAVSHAVQVVEHIRKKNPNLPVLFMYQPVEYYSKLAERRDFYRLPEAVAAILPHVYPADILNINDLGIADMGSCGAGQTLHFDGGTYRRMIESAWLKGLSRHFSQPSVACSSPTITNAPPSNLADLDTTALAPIAINYGGGRSMCRDTCRNIPEAAIKTFSEYIIHPDKGESPLASKRFVPMTIELGDFDIDSFTNYLKRFSKGFQLREIKRAVKLGLYCKPFAWKLHIPDIHEINHSKTSRSGGEMRGSYLRSIEEMGGAPDRDYPVVPPACNNHWSVSFGAFEQRAGYVQGSVTTNEKLLGYISLRRTGDIALYSQILGHADFLQKGIMMLLHMDVLAWLSKKEVPAVQGLKFLMYGGAANGGQPLYSWKRKAGFRPARLVGFRDEEQQLRAELPQP